MLTLHMSRFAESDWGTMGRLFVPDGPDLYTLEDEWENNRRNISRIPAGVYVCEATTYWRHNIPTYEVTDVPDRSRILFHPGNTEEDTAGCILLGMAFGPVKVVDEETGEDVVKLGVWQSQKAFNEFMEAMEGEERFRLNITDPWWKV